MSGNVYCKHIALLLLTTVFAIGNGVAAKGGTEESTPPKKTEASSKKAEASSEKTAESSKKAAKPVKRKLDRSGRKRVGKASYYAKKFAGKKMADGTAMRPQGDNAASKTLPLGTKARVTNLETGQSALVTIRDRGPHVKGRIVDLSPATAEKIGIDREEGVAKVEVAPVAIPQADDGTKRGPATHEEKSKAGGSNR